MVLFDEQDVDLFRIEDFDLKARAIRNSIIPRLLEVVNSAIAEVGRVYGCEPMDGMTLTYSPYNTESKGTRFLCDFKSASAGLGPQRMKGAYPVLGVDKKILQVSLRMVLDGDATGVICGINCTAQRFRRCLFDLLEQNEIKLLALQAAVQGSFLVWDGTCWNDIIYPWCETFRAFRKSSGCRLLFRSFCLTPPFEEGTRRFLEVMFVAMYPLLRAVYDIGRSGQLDFDRLLTVALDYLREMSKRKSTQTKRKKDGQDGVPVAASLNSSEGLNIAGATQLAEKRAHVMPGKRWRVFERDGWRCVSCGRGVDEGVILEVDHVLPRSRGGSDSLDNLQTLCRECNIGKSNKSKKNLRASSVPAV